MGSALVGYTGFVGGNLMRAGQYDALFNSTNIGDIAGRDFDLVVFSAAKAEKWRINQEPESDFWHILELEETLRSFRTERLVLISTVDVYGAPRAVDESTEIDTDGLHPYGAHRLRLERTARGIHPTTVLRLPGLFGPGLKKNVVFDLLHNNGVDRIDPRGSFQYYDLTRLQADLTVAVSAELALANLVTEPFATARIAGELFGLDLPEPDRTPVAYDVRTRHSNVFGGSGDYLESADAVMERLAAYVESVRS